MADKINVCIAGATGWAGSELAKGVIEHPSMELVSSVSRTDAGKNLVDILGKGHGHIPIFREIGSALQTSCDVMVEYTHPDSARNHIMSALSQGVNVIVGTSGLSSDDYMDIEELAIENNCSVMAVGNFAITAVLMQKFAEMAAQYIPNWEIIDYAHSGKIDVPSGTARELANRLGRTGESATGVPIEDIKGPKETRGARMDGTQVHSVRLPGYIISLEALFGLPDEKLTIRYDAGASSLPYVAGALLAIEKSGTFQGLKRGLDSVMGF